MVPNLSIINLYIINFLLAFSTTVGMSVLPFVATDKLKISILMFGIIEGSCELLSALLKLYSGKIYDKIKNKNILFTLTAIFAFGSKVILFIPAAIAVFISKTFERISNGIFSSPRDVYVLDGAKNRGLELAIINCTKNLGCVIGPSFVAILCYSYGGLDLNLSFIIWACVIMTIIPIIMSFFIKNKELIIKSDKSISVVKLLKNKQLSGLYLLTLVYFLARFNDGFLGLFLKSKGYEEALYTSTIAIFNTAMLIVSPIFGILLDRKKIKIAGCITIISLILFNIVFYNLPSCTKSLGDYLTVILGLTFWGIQRSGAQVVFCHMIYNNAPKDCKGTAVGIFCCISGIGTFIAALICGYISSTSLTYTFVMSGLVSLLTMFVFNKVTNDK